MKIVFLDASTLGAASLEPIAALGELVCYPYSSPAEALERVRDAEVLIINKVKVTAALMDAAPRLKLICEAATGVNNIDLDAAAERGIPVKNVAGYSTDSVVQLTFALILNLLCRTASYDTYVKSGAYSASPIFTEVSRPFTELAGKTMGIVGMGTIGQRVAAAAQAFGMKVIYFSTSGTSHCKDYPSMDIDTLMTSSDIVSIHAPLNARTNGLIGARELALMRPSAIIINIGRGGIVNEQALADAISGERIAGAGLDVFTSEPLPADNPLLHTAHPERLSFTPHIGWASKEALNRLVQGIAYNIISL
ncbi:MAG: D-2-hydroxyacid dehydrogenase [Bacteroidales bacterium]|nr:D-2-hydroxyacid dehydrogenase [Bacteroidales bacterium]